MRCHVSSHPLRGCMIRIRCGSRDFQAALNSLVIRNKKKTLLERATIWDGLWVNSSHALTCPDSSALKIQAGPN